MSDKDKSAEEAKIRKIKQLQMVICICKGIKLGSVLKGLPGSKTVEDVNRKTGCGSGGCAGERCGPRIKVLLEKQRINLEKNPGPGEETPEPDQK